jgi:ribosome assembly protein YihI (activator of Der GTPase)
MIEITLSFETQEQLDALLESIEAGEVEGATVVEVQDEEVAEEVAELVEEDEVEA